jgi:hypothetical protein
MIKFQCPNGHTLSTGEDRAGTAAKCPKCQAPVVVPMLSTVGKTAGGSKVNAAGSGVAGGSSVAAGSGKQPSGSSKQAAAPVPSPDLIVFLCPNGHKLNGPARMKGKAGQCPHCGAKFRIPDDDEEDIEEVAEFEEEQVAESMSEEQFAEEFEEVDIEEITEFEEESEDVDELEPFEEAPPTIIDAFLSAPPEDTHLYASMIRQLWAAKEPGQVIDLYLQKGEVLSPELFAESLSSPQFGIFGRREKDGGGHTLIMLPWENITRIEIRHVKQVPVGILR